MTVQECVAGCGRPVKGDGLPVCEEHVEAWTADYWWQQWQICGNDLLPPLVELARQFGNEPLEDLLREGIERAKFEAERYEVVARDLRSQI